MLCLHLTGTTQARTSNPVPITFPNFSQCMETHESTEHILHTHIYIFETNRWSMNLHNVSVLGTKKFIVGCALQKHRMGRENYLFSMLRTK